MKNLKTRLKNKHNKKNFVVNEKKKLKKLSNMKKINKKIEKSY